MLNDVQVLQLFRFLVVLIIVYTFFVRLYPYAYYVYNCLEYFIMKGQLMKKCMDIVFIITFILSELYNNILVILTVLYQPIDENNFIATISGLYDYCKYGGISITICI